MVRIATGVHQISGRERGPVGVAHDRGLPSGHAHDQGLPPLTGPRSGYAAGPGPAAGAALERREYAIT